MQRRRSILTLLDSKPPGVRPLRLSSDPLRKTHWMHTKQSIFELVVKDEDRDVWKIYLARSNWELARKYAKVSFILRCFLPILIPSPR
jgi:hypothetical protein